MTLQVFYLASLYFGVVAYVLLTLFCIVTWARGITGRAAFLASAVTLVYLLSEALAGIGALSLSLEAIAILSWIGLLSRVIGVGPRRLRLPVFRQVVVVIVAAALIAGIAAIYPWIAALGTEEPGWPLAGLFTSQLLLALCGLVLLEQVVRNTRDDYRWRLRYLNIGLGTFFAFQVLHNACALLFNAYLPALLAIQPAVLAMAAPFIALASLRNPSNPLRLNLSRRFVFGSGVLVATGVLLLMMGLLGYLVRLTDGEWMTALLMLLAIVAAMVTVTVLGSSTVRLRARRWVEENLLPAKYDYREEWRRVTGQLTEPSPDYDLSQQTLRALSGILKSNAGAIWRVSASEALLPAGHWHAPWSAPLAPPTTAVLRRLFEHEESVLDLQRLQPAAQEQLAGCQDLLGLDRLRFIVPLMTDSKLFGIAALTDPAIPLSLDSEDQAVIKLIAREAAGFLALQEADRELADAEKLHGLNQLSAFLIHDVKTVTSQLQLLVANAAKHKRNPAFVDDMVQTVDNAAHRLGKLLSQLRNENDQSATPPLSLAEELKDLVDSFARAEPKPELRIDDDAVAVAASASHLRSAVGHLVQNAIDASNQSASRGHLPAVCVTLRRDPPWAEVIVADNGPGMDDSFVKSGLFQPFNSTKGVAGMGIGAYQARAFARSRGGDLEVQSRIGAGSSFTLRLPLVSAND